MSPVEFSLFSDLNREAAKITCQNAEYERLASVCGRSESARNAQNRVAVEQAAHLRFLGEMSVELPYAELGEKDVEIDRSLKAARGLLACIESTSNTEKLGVQALASRLVLECYPESEANITAHAVERMQAIDVVRRAELEERIQGLEEERDEMAGIFESAGAAWPVPLAFFIPQPDSEKNFRPAGEPSSARTSIELVPGEVIAEEEVPSEETECERSEAERLQQFRERHIDQPEASPLMAFYLIEHKGKTVEADELVDFLYSHLKEGYRERHELRSRVTTAFGKKLQGWRIQRLLAAEGHVLQYGWRHYVKEEDGRTKQVSRRRAYRAWPAHLIEDELPEFIETVDAARVAA
jgi:hypothetical protein